MKLPRGWLGDLGAGSGSQNVRGQTYLSPRVLGFQVGDIGPGPVGVGLSLA